MENRQPTFSFITAVYLSAPYLPEYLASLEAIEGGHDDLEILFVNDGSPDESASIIEDWIATTGAPARLITKEHGSSGSARNVGLDHAQGIWVSFPDPDDALDVRYLAAIREFLGGLDPSSGEVAVVATKVVQFTDSAGNAVDNHILGYRYHQGARCARLAEEPRFFHTHAPSGFYRRDVIERAGLRLDLRLSAAFEDAAFVAEYLLEFDDPIVGVVPDAVYAYRRRSDSVTGSMWSKPDRYTAVPEHGYLRLLTLREDPPTWLQLLVLYDLIWYLYEYEQPDSPNRQIDDTVAASFLEQLDQVLARLDETNIYGYCLHPLQLHIRAALTARKTGRLAYREAYVVSDRHGSLRLTYFLDPHQTTHESEVVTVDGLVRRPVVTTDRTIEYYGQVFLIERTLEIEASGTVMLFIDRQAYALCTQPQGTGALFRWDREPDPVNETVAAPQPSSTSTGLGAWLSRRRQPRRPRHA